MDSNEKDVVFFIADISGYTRFMVSNEKDLSHSQIIVKELINTIIEQIEMPLEVIKLEGDAIWLYADKNDPQNPWDKTKDTIVASMMSFFKVFSHKIGELTVHKICNCNACNNIERLKLKVIVHSGKTVFYQVNGHEDLVGTDAIIVHRLLKNSVSADEYILLTEPAYQDLPLPEGKVEESQENYDEIGTIKTYIYYPPEPEPYQPDSDDNYPNIFVETLRSEVQQEYAIVADHPEEGFHFHTGRRLTDLLDYSDELLNGFPDSVIESFAGTGNPFKLGDLKEGEKVLDIGSGAGLDSLIAGRIVGEQGKVIGVDMTPQMVEKARKNAAEVGADNVDFHWGFSEELPIEDNWADVVMSNGAINLSPHKETVFDEIYRVLKPGGRIQIADILIDKPIPESAKNNIDLWAG